MCAVWNPRVVWDRCRLQRGEQNWSGCWELSTLLGGGVIETYMTIKTCELKGNAYFIVGKLHLGKNTDRVRKKRTPPEFHSQVCVGMCWEMHSHRAKNDLFWLHREWGRGSSLKTKKKNQCVSPNKLSSWALGDNSLSLNLAPQAEAVPSASRLISDTQQTPIRSQREDWVMKQVMKFWIRMS